jgi:hypothetical protein
MMNSEFCFSKSQLMQTSQLQQQWGKFYGDSAEAENLKKKEI